MKSPDKETREFIYGINLGGKNDPVQPVIDRLKKRGLNITGPIVTYLRSGSYKGRLITEQLLSIDQLGQNDTSPKNHLYSELMRTGIELRKSLMSTTGRYSALDLISDVSTSISESEHLVRSLLRSMRADLISVDQIESSEKDRSSFQQSVGEYLEAYQSPPSHQPKIFNILDEEWNRQSIADFYRLLYKNASTWTIATWTPYEFGVLHNFYNEQIERNSPLTPYDKSILKATRDDLPSKQLVQKMHSNFSIPLRRSDIRLHKNLLLYGGLRVNKNLYKMSN